MTSDNREAPDNVWSVVVPADAKVGSPAKDFEMVREGLGPWRAEDNEFIAALERIRADYGRFLQTLIALAHPSMDTHELAHLSDMQQEDGHDAPLSADDLFMGRPVYYDRQGNPIRHEEAYRLFADPQHKRVAEDQIGEAWVSTVHLMIDHSFGTGPPIIFETMIFGGPHDEWCDRYATETEAQTGHARVVDALRDGRAP